ncbi:hypothetical protein WHT83_24640 (plasmid) [Aminobacter sp. P9b]|uniref:hypothetical protein n=1 Tax=Aminobacter sp. P9b TaxID=3133697 RepID=UPI0031383501
MPPGEFLRQSLGPELAQANQDMICLPMWKRARDLVWRPTPFHRRWIFDAPSSSTMGHRTSVIGFIIKVVPHYFKPTLISDNKTLMRRNTSSIIPHPNRISLRFDGPCWQARLPADAKISSSPDFMEIMAILQVMCWSQV